MREIVKSGKATKTFTPDELKAIKLKTPDQYTMIGVSVPQLDIPSKTNGTAKYGIDVMLPGMVYGKLVTPPVRYGATVKSVDDSDAKKVPGFIKAVTLDDKTGSTTRLGGGGRQHLCQRRARTRRRAEDHLGQRARTPSCRASRARRSQAAADDSTIPGCSSSRTAIRPRPCGTAAKVLRGRIHHQHQHPCAAGADERDCRAEGRHLAHLYRQPVRDALRRDRGRGGRGRSQDTS